MLRWILSVFVVAVCVASWVLKPQRHMVSGLSMAPTFSPGDIVSSGWCPYIDPYFAPQRFECWFLITPDGTPIIKRLFGLPGETIRFSEGDLTVNDTVVLTPPTVLADIGTFVTDCEAGDGSWQRVFASQVILDDTDFSSEESRRLLPVRDVGLSIEIDTVNLSHPCIQIRVGSQAIEWNLPPGKFGLVAGRLDGHLVASAWTLNAFSDPHDCLPLPTNPPRIWQICEHWKQLSDTPETAPTLAVRILKNNTLLDVESTEKHLKRCAIWRDILHRSLGTDSTGWVIGPREVFVLGDFPSGSRDCRHWGPLPLSCLSHRITKVDNQTSSETFKKPEASTNHLHAEQ